MPLKTILIGFGQIAQGLSSDELMARYFTYATHAQVLGDHPEFSLEAVVDPSPDAVKAARNHWRIPIAEHSMDRLPSSFQPDVAVIASPPEHRKAILDGLPSLKAILVEKPLGTSYKESLEFIKACETRGLLVQVNYWRRGDRFFQELADSKLQALIGRPQAVFGIYGNGLVNNGTHMVDFIRMLLGEITDARILSPELRFIEGPGNKEVNLSFSLTIGKTFTATLQPVRFSRYRENSLDIWGENGRLALYLESLGIYYYPIKDNRALKNEREVASDQPVLFEPTCGDALYRMYDNLSEAVFKGERLWSEGRSALKNEQIIHQILDQS
jgi:predicted dehydrogenase